MWWDTAGPAGSKVVLTDQATEVIREEGIGAGQADLPVTGRFRRVKNKSPRRDRIFPATGVKKNACGLLHYLATSILATVNSCFPATVFTVPVAVTFWGPWQTFSWKFFAASFWARW